MLLDKIWSTAVQTAPHCRIADPEAVKPDDWDEDAPRQVPDEDAEKPEGWLDAEPAEIDDPGECRSKGPHEEGAAWTLLGD